MSQANEQNSRFAGVLLIVLFVIGFAYCLMLAAMRGSAYAPEQERLHNRGVLVWQGQLFDMQSLEPEYGYGYYTSETGIHERWVYFPEAGVTFCYDKESRIIKRCLRGRFGDITQQRFGD